MTAISQTAYIQIHFVQCLAPNRRQAIAKIIWTSVDKPIGEEGYSNKDPRRHMVCLCHNELIKEGKISEPHSGQHVTHVCFSIKFQ